MISSSPKVSVVITCYNYAKYVAEAIESILNQTYSNIDLLIIDDGSTDNSLDIINKYKDNDGVRIITRENKGIVYTRNEAIKLTEGEFLLFLDADDYFDKDYVEKMVEVAQKYSADVVYPNWRVFGDEEYTKEFPEFNIQRLVRQEIHCSSESLIRKSAIGEHRFESEEVAEDWDFFLGIALAGGRFKLAKGCYINYRVLKGGRGTASPYWEDMRRFYKILEKWKSRYPDKVDPLDLPIYAGRIRDDHIESQNRIIHQKEDIIHELEVTLQSRESLIKNLQLEIGGIKQSRAYKISKLLQRPVSYARHLKEDVKTWMVSAKEGSGEEGEYSRSLLGLKRELRVDSRNKDKVAVIVHLYYTDNWPLFKEKLQLLPPDSFDLFITMPKRNLSFEPEVRKDFPVASIVQVPNRGRDVLPFTKVARELKGAGYRIALKFHSKKSTHREDGQDWLESMLHQIIPEDPSALSRIMTATKRDKFGILGPADVYYPLSVNFPANGRHMTRILTDIYNKHTADAVLQSGRKSHGFFGGTMFWVSLDAIGELLSYKASRFESEAGQIDATFAHALERLFCVLPEIKGLDVYESNGRNVRKRPYASKNVPEWSEDHDK